LSIAASITNKTMLTAGATAELVCVGQPGNFVDISWTYNRKMVSNGDRVSVLDNIDPSDGGKRSVLRYEKMSAQDNGIRVCTVSSDCGTVTSTLELSVQSESVTIGSGTW